MIWSNMTVPDRKAAIIAEALEQMTMQQIAAKYGTDVAKIKRFALAHGLSIPGRFTDRPALVKAAKKRGITVRECEARVLNAVATEYVLVENLLDESA